MNEVKRKYHKITTETPFAITEAYKTTRTNLMFALASSQNNTFVVTSPNPGEGKTTTAVNLAITFALSGKSVLLIDADLRRPTIHNYFNLKNNFGLSSVLGMFNKLSDTVQSNVYTNLDVITSGKIPPNPAELLGSDIMKKLVESVKPYYDYIIIDCPPINSVTDSQLMNDVIAGIVIVVKEGMTTHPQIEEALRRIKLANGKMLGIVRISSKTGKHSSYSHYANKYSSYD